MAFVASGSCLQLSACAVAYLSQAYLQAKGTCGHGFQSLLKYRPAFAEVFFHLL